jgi:hypothetical protein
MTVIPVVLLMMIEERVTMTSISPVICLFSGLNSTRMRKIFEDAKREHGGVWRVFYVLAFPGLGANADGEEKQGKVRQDDLPRCGCFE